MPNITFSSPELHCNTGMQATHKTSSSTSNVLLSSFLLRLNRTTLQTRSTKFFNHAIWPIKIKHSHWLYSKGFFFTSCNLAILAKSSLHPPWVDFSNYGTFTSSLFKWQRFMSIPPFFCHVLRMCSEVKASEINFCFEIRYTIWIVLTF